MDATSVHVNKYGDVLKNIDDGDNHVYEHDDAKSTKDVDKKYSANNTSAGGKDIGELGKKIDVNNILINVLARDGAIAANLTEKQWINKVLPGALPGDHPWDLKNNMSTIFGVAWAHDQANSGLPNTFFQFGDFQIDGKFTAADVGNFHAGYTGIAAGVSHMTQYRLAGLGEIAKLRSANDMLRRTAELCCFPPYGDQQVDYEWNTAGMNAAISVGFPYK